MNSSEMFVYAILFSSSIACVVNCLGQDVLTGDIMARIQALEEKVGDQARLLEQYQTDLSSLQAVVGSQSTRMQHQERLLRGYVKKVDQLKQRLTRLSQADTKQYTDVNHEPDVENMAPANEHTMPSILTRGPHKGIVKRNVAIQRRYVDWGPVYFHAVISAPGAHHVSGYQTVIFPKVISSAGGGYNNDSGVFTASKPGLYIISLSVESDYGKTVFIDIVKNGVSLARAIGDGSSHSYGHGSVTIPAMLAIGDTVWVKVHASAGYIYGNGESSFMAVLVIPS